MNRKNVFKNIEIMQLSKFHKTFQIFFSLIKKTHILNSENPSFYAFHLKLKFFSFFLPTKKIKKIKNSINFSLHSFFFRTIYHQYFLILPYSVLNII